MILFCGVTRAEIIDRIAIIVGSDAILDSDIQRDIRLTSFLNGQLPTFSISSRRAAASRLIDQDLIRKQILAGSYPAATKAQVDALVSQVKNGRFGNEVGYRRALGRYGIDEASLRDRLSWQSTVLAFIDARFRPEVIISDQEVHTYMTSHRNVKLTEAEAREVIIGERVNALLNSWLADARKETRAEYLEKSLK